MKKCLIAIYCMTTFLPCILGFSRKIKLGSLFDRDDICQQTFLASINAVNKLRRISKDLANVQFVPESAVTTNDLFDVSQSVCNLFDKGVAGIFGPSEKISAEHVQSMCETADMPNMVSRWDIEPAPLKAINLYPAAEGISMVFHKLVTHFKWTSFTILYENFDGLLRTRDLLKRTSPNGYPVTVRRLGSGPNFRDVLMKVKQSEEVNVIIDCSYEILEEVLKQSLQIGILSNRFNVIVTNLDLQTIDLQPYGYSGVNLTGIRLVDVDNPEAQSTFNNYMSKLGLKSLSQLRVDAAIAYDAVQLFARAFKKFRDIVDGDVAQLVCDGLESWELGTSLINYIRTTEIRGLTGLVKIHTNGFRSDFELDIVQLNKTGLKKVGKFNSTRDVEWQLDEDSKSILDNNNLQDVTLKVLIPLTPPYNMLKDSSELEVGNDRYEGFTVEIIQELSKILHFNYTFIESSDDYGSKGDDGKMSGMLGAIIAEEGDLAITDLTITSERESVVDFTNPFMNLGITILYKKPRKAPPNVFSFLSPFSYGVWFFLTVSWIIISLWFTLIGRMCPAEWNNRDPCLEDPEELENQFTLSNSLWFAMGGITQQGSGVSPIGSSTKLMAAWWGFFCMSLMKSYTANLAAALVLETTVKPIKSAEDLANLNGAIQYGAKRGGTTFKFFETATYPTYQKMYQYMIDHEEEVMTETNEDGRDKVLDDNHNYAFLMESSTIQYIQERECNVTQIGGLLDSKFYGIAMRKNYKHRGALNTAVLQLQENGVISQLRKKWWKEKRDGGRCKKVVKKSGVTPLTIDHVSGVFWFLEIAVAISVLITFWEFVWNVSWNARKQNLSIKDEFIKEMKFVLRCKGQVKKSRYRKSSSRMSQSNSHEGTPPYGVVPTVVTTTCN